MLVEGRSFAVVRAQDALGRLVHETVGVVGSLKGWLDGDLRRER